MAFNSLYIGASSCVSVQDTFDRSDWFTAIQPLTGAYQKALLPDYKKFLDPMATRRMSKVLKNTLLTARQALGEMSLEAPDAVITATAWGCQEDTGKFLDAVESMGEELLSPTAFIQSTHNTIGGLVAMSVKCNGYNNTISHDFMSFETALLDAALLMREDPEIRTCYVGGIDELTDLSAGIFTRTACLRSSYPISEAAVSFILHNQKNITKRVALTEIACLYSEEELLQYIADKQPEGVLTSTEFPSITQPSINYRKYCGEFSTAAAFGLYLAVELLTKSGCAEAIGYTGPTQRIAIVNAYPGNRYSYMEVQAC